MNEPRRTTPRGSEIARVRLGLDQTIQAHRGEGLPHLHRGGELRLEDGLQSTSESCKGAGSHKLRGGRSLHQAFQKVLEMLCRPPGVDELDSQLEEPFLRVQSEPADVGRQHQFRLARRRRKHEGDGSSDGEGGWADETSAADAQVAKIRDRPLPGSDDVAPEIDGEARLAGLLTPSAVDRDDRRSLIHSVYKYTRYLWHPPKKKNGR